MLFKRDEGDYILEENQSFDSRIFDEKNEVESFEQFQNKKQYRAMQTNINKNVGR